MLSTIFTCLVEDFIRNISGPVGIRLRRAWYGRRFARCGPGLVIEPNVSIIGARFIELGAHAWIDQRVSLIAGPVHDDPTCTKRGVSDDTKPGLIRIGDNAHVGVGTIIQGHGGVTIGDYFTSAPHAKIYSYSNDQRRCRQGTMRIGGAMSFFVMTPVRIGDNVWIGMNVTVVGHTIGSDVFVRPNAVVTQDIEEDSIAAGDPATRTGARFSVESGVMQ